MLNFIAKLLSSSKPKPPKKPADGIHKVTARILNEDGDDLDLFETTITDQEMLHMRAALKKHMKLFPPRDIKPNQDPDIKKLLKKGVEAAKNKDTFDDAIHYWNEAFKLDEKKKELSLYHYIRIPKIYLKKKDPETAFRETAKLWKGIPAIKPSNTSEWYAYESRLQDLSAEIIISEKRYAEAVPFVIGEIEDLFHSHVLAVKESKDTPLLDVWRNSDILQFKHQHRFAFVEIQEEGNDFYNFIERISAEIRLLDISINMAEEQLEAFKNNHELTKLETLFRKAKKEDLYDSVKSSVVKAISGSYSPEEWDQIRLETEKLLL